MGERGQGVLAYAIVLLLVGIIAGGVVIAAGRSLGGVPGEVYDALRARLVGDEGVAVDRTAPVPVGNAPQASPRLTLDPKPTVEPVFIVPLSLQEASDGSCASFSFRGAIHIQEGRVAFNPFTVVSPIEPYRDSDPLASWKLLRFEVFAFDVEDVDGESHSTFPVGEAVNLSVLDPFTEDVLLSARWSIAEIETNGPVASVNAGLETNLSQVRVNNSIASETLASFETAANGVLVLRFQHTQDIATALRSGAPLYAPVTGLVRAARCLR